MTREACALRAPVRLTILASLVLTLHGCARDEATMLAGIQGRLDKDEVAAAVIESRNFLNDRTKSAPGRLLLGKALLASGDLAGAEIEIARAKEFGLPEDLWLPTWADLLLAQQRPAVLIESHSDTVLSNPASQAELRLALARAYRGVGDAKTAEAMVDDALSLQPGNADALVLRARLAAARDDVQMTRSIAQELAASAPENAQALLLRADLLAQDVATRPDAVAAYRKALSLRPRLVEAHGNLISLLLEMGDLPAAKGQAAAMRKALPGRPLADFYQALVAYIEGDHKRVRELTQPLIRGENDSPQVLYLAGMAEQRLGALDAAERLLSRSVAALPTALEPRRELGALYVRRSRPEAALLVLKPLMDGGSEDASTWRYAGQAHALAGDFRQADAAFAKAAKFQPDDPRTVIAVGAALLARGDVDAGTRTLQGAADLDAKGIDADLALVSVHVQRREFEKALRVVDGIARKRPGAALPDQLAGNVHLRRGDTVAARRAFEQALTREQNFAPAIESLARLDIADGRPEAARQRFEALVKRDQRAARAMMALAELGVSTGGSRSQAAEWVARAVRVDPTDAAMWRNAISYHRSIGDVSAALSTARSALAAVPNDPELLSAVVDTQMYAADLQQAVATAQKLTQVSPQSADAWTRLSGTHLAAGNPGAARQAASRALDLSRDAPAALRSMLAALVQERQFAEARALVSSVQTRSPADPLGWQLAGEVEAAEGRWDAASEAFRAALSKRQSTPVAMQFHRAMLRSGQLPEAARFEDRWLRENSNDVVFLAHLAQEAMARRDWSAAEKSYRQILKLRPKDAPVLNNLAYVLVQRRDPAALEFAQAAVGLTPYLAAVVDTYALALDASGQTAKAIEAQVKSVELEPQSARYRLQLAKLYLKTGDKKKARDELGRLERQNPGPELKDEVGRLLQQAQG